MTCGDAGVLPARPVDDGAVVFVAGGYFHIAETLAAARLLLTQISPADLVTPGTAVPTFAEIIPKRSPACDGSRCHR